ncbi:hypothetical protein PSTT_01339, partial [Puccinia striiformis]
MVVDKAITELKPIIGESSRPTMEEERSEDFPVEDVEGVPLSIFEEEASDDEEGELNWTDMIGITVRQIDLEPKDAILDATSSLFPWYPFLNEEVGVWIFKYQEEENKIDLPFYLIGLLLLGYLHKFISGDLYHQFRLVFTTYHVKLPRWEALRGMRANIQKLISHTTTEKETVFGQPVLGLNARELIRDDLMNPLILPHLEFVPQDAHGLDIYKMFQLSKWLKHLKPDLQVQMVESNKKHFYIFEPVQLKTRVIVVPFFFFTHNEKYFAKCYKPIIKSDVDQSKLEIHLSSNIPYDDDRLKVISVDEFYLMYNEIAIKNGLKLSECCGGKMIGEKIIGKFI